MTGAPSRSWGLDKKSPHRKAGAKIEDIKKVKGIGQPSMSRSGNGQRKAECVKRKYLPSPVLHSAVFLSSAIHFSQCLHVCFLLLLVYWSAQVLLPRASVYGSVQQPDSDRYSEADELHPDENNGPQGRQQIWQ